MVARVRGAVTAVEIGDRSRLLSLLAPSNFKATDVLGWLPPEQISEATLELQPGPTYAAVAALPRFPHLTSLILLTTSFSAMLAAKLAALTGLRLLHVISDYLPLEAAPALLCLRELEELKLSTWERPLPLGLPQLTALRRLRRLELEDNTGGVPAPPAGTQAAGGAAVGYGPLRQPPLPPDCPCLESVTITTPGNPCEVGACSPSLPCCLWPRLRTGRVLPLMLAAARHLLPPLPLPVGAHPRSAAPSRQPCPPAALHVTRQACA